MPKPIKKQLKTTLNTTLVTCDIIWKIWNKKLKQLYMYIYTMTSVSFKK